MLYFHFKTPRKHLGKKLNRIKYSKTDAISYTFKQGGIIVLKL